MNRKQHNARMAAHGRAVTRGLSADKKRDEKPATPRVDYCTTATLCAYHEAGGAAGERCGTDTLAGLERDALIEMGIEPMAGEDIGCK